MLRASSKPLTSTCNTKGCEETLVGREGAEHLWAAALSPSMLEGHKALILNSKGYAYKSLSYEIMA